VTKSLTKVGTSRAVLLSVKMFTCIKFRAMQWRNYRFEPGGETLAEGGPLANTQKKVEK